MSAFLACALGVVGVAFKSPEPKFTEEDKAFFSMLQAMGDVQMIGTDRKKSLETKPGDFVVFSGKYEEWLWFKDHGFEMFPMKWRKSFVMRRRLFTSA